MLPSSTPDSSPYGGIKSILTFGFKTARGPVSASTLALVFSCILFLFTSTLTPSPSYSQVTPIYSKPLTSSHPPSLLPLILLSLPPHPCPPPSSINNLPSLLPSLSSLLRHQPSLL